MIKHFTYKAPMQDAKESAIGFMGFIDELYKKHGNVIIIKKLEIKNSDDVDEDGCPMSCSVECGVAVE